MYRNDLWEQEGKIFHTTEMKNEMSRRGGDSIESEPTHPGQWPRKGRNITTVELILKQWEAGPHVGLPSAGYCTGKISPPPTPQHPPSPRISGLENQRDLCLGELKSWRKQRFHSWRSCTKSHKLWVPAQREEFEKSPSKTCLLILQSLLERQEATVTSPEDGDTGHLGECIL